MDTTIKLFGKYWYYLFEIVAHLRSSPKQTILPTISLISHLHIIKIKSWENIKTWGPPLSENLLLFLFLGFSRNFGYFSGTTALTKCNTTETLLLLTYANSVVILVLVHILCLILVYISLLLDNTVVVGTTSTSTTQHNLNTSVGLDMKTSSAGSATLGDTTQ